MKVLTKKTNVLLERLQTCLRRMGMGWYMSKITSSVFGWRRGRISIYVFIMMNLMMGLGLVEVVGQSSCESISVPYIRLVGDANSNHLENLQQIGNSFYAIGKDGSSGTFSKFNLEGQIIWTTNFGIETRLNDYVETDDNAFLIIGNGADGNLIAKIDENGNLLSNAYYDFNNSGLGFTDIVRIDSPVSTPKYFITGSSGGSGNQGSFLIKVTEDGIANSMIRIDYGAGSQFISELIELNNNQLGLAGVSGPFGFIGQLDTVGNILSAFSTNPFSIIEDVTNLPGSNDLVIVGSANFLSSPAAIIGRINNAGQTIWAKIIPDIGVLSKIVRASNGSYYALGYGSINGSNRYSINHFVENGASVELMNTYVINDGGSNSPNSSRPGDLNIAPNDLLLFSQAVFHPLGFGNIDAYLGFFDSDFSLNCKQDTVLQNFDYDLTLTPNVDLSTSIEPLPIPSISTESGSLIYDCFTLCESIDPEPCLPLPDTCCNAPVDVLFVLDNSGSVDPIEFADMITLAQNSIMEVDSGYCDALFAVAHYSGGCGDEIYIEHDFSLASIAQNINRPTTFGGVGDDLNAALGTLINALDNTADPLIISTTAGFLNKRTGVPLLLVIFTDAGSFFATPGNCIGSGSAMGPYDNANILKLPPYNANITLVHLQPGNPGVGTVGAAIASPGGSYTGAVDPNPADPTNSLIPRQYIPTTFSNTSINLLSATPSCDSLIEFICCDELLVQTNGVVNPNACCYNIDLTNNTGPTVTCFEVEILSPGWQFNTGSLTIGSSFNWQATPSNNKLTIEHSSGTIPATTSVNALEYCLVQNTPSPPATQLLVHRWYQVLPDMSKRVVCTDTIIQECDPIFPNNCVAMNDPVLSCNPDNPYEYLVSFTVTNNSNFDADRIVLEDLNPGFAFSFCGNNSATNIIALPTDPAILLPGATSNPMCVKIISPYPIFNPEQVCFDIGLFGEFDCCHTTETVCLLLENCCDPCEQRNITQKDIQTDSSDCCYSFDIIDSCGYAYFTKLETEIITPGVIFGYHALGGAAAPDWFVLPNSNQTSIIWWNNSSSFIPYGTTEDIIQFCLSGITTQEQIPQQVVFKWFAQTGGGDEFIACTDTLTFDCQIPEGQYSCLDISDRDLVCDEANQQYTYTFTVTNTSTIPFSADYLDVSILQPSGIYFDPTGGIFPLPQPFNPGDSHLVTTSIKSNTTFPVTPQDLIMRYRLRFAQGDTCCYESVLDSLFLPPCGPADCDSLMVMVDQSTSDSCCHTLDFKNLYNAPVHIIELEVLTAGVIFGNHSTGGNNPGQWTNPMSTPVKIQWALQSGNRLPFGYYDDLVQFCLDGINAGETPQHVAVNWLDDTGMLLCSDTLQFDCIGDYHCIDLTGSQLSCDDNGDYTFNFTVVNNSNPSNPADLLKIRTVPPTNSIQITNGSYPLSPLLDFGESYNGSTTITGAVPGDTLRLEMRLENTSSGRSWCCFESDTFLIVIPSCCCTDSTAFFDLVDMGMDTILICDSLLVKGVGLGSCHQVIWSWDDGSPDSDPVAGNDYVSHVFDWPGDYNVCMLAQNLDDDGNLCWEEQYCEMLRVTPCCDVNTIVINNGLTPNGDGFNDEFKISGIEKCKGVSITIFNRWGNIVYEQNDYEEGPNWNGLSKTRLELAQGTYYYIIKFKDIGKEKAGYLDVRY